MTQVAKIGLAKVTSHFDNAVGFNVNWPLALHLALCVMLLSCESNTNSGSVERSLSTDHCNKLTRGEVLGCRLRRTSAEELVQMWSSAVDADPPSALGRGVRQFTVRNIEADNPSLLLGCRNAEEAVWSFVDNKLYDCTLLVSVDDANIIEQHFRECIGQPTGTKVKEWRVGSAKCIIARQSQATLISVRDVELWSKASDRHVAAMDELRNE